MRVTALPVSNKPAFSRHTGGRDALEPWIEGDSVFDAYKWSPIAQPMISSFTYALKVARKFLSHGVWALY